MTEQAGAELQRVSIAMATYNGERYLNEQLESLARQTLLPLELVVTDDRSTDSTLEILQSFAQHAGFPVRIFSNEPRLGFADNFLKAASLCSGPLVGFCDQDDVWSERKLATCAPYFSDPNVMLCAHTASVWNGAHVSGEFFPHFQKTGLQPASSLDPFFLIPGFTMVFRASLLQLTNNRSRLRHIFNLGPPSVPMHHDSWVWLLASSIGIVATISDSLASYRQHNNNTVGVPPHAEKRRSLLLALTDTDYSGLAELEAECAELLFILAEELPSILSENAKGTAVDFARRSKYHQLRSGIYKPKANIFDRFASYRELFVSGAYENTRPLVQLGSRAAIKDLGLGVAGLYKLRAHV